jgi:hypothetical protein
MRAAKVGLRVRPLHELTTQRRLKIVDYLRFAVSSIFIDCDHETRDLYHFFSFAWDRTVQGEVGTPIQPWQM